MDADFCAQFIKVMHLQGTPGFPTLMTYDKVCLAYLTISPVLIQVSPVRSWENM